MSHALQVTTYLCQDCGWSDFHPTSHCPACNGDITQTANNGEGEVVTYTAIRYPPKGFEDQAPYVVAIINLKKGPRVIGRILNAADGVKIGSRVSLSAWKQGTLEFRLSN
ncbi:MAG TPA: OB-fold domain-containing protein [archaeon]|nr:OB-fold domain-containing protein [archaeon]